MQAKLSGYFLAVGLGVLYLALMPFKPYPLSWLLKPLPMLIFAALMWRAYPGSVGRWLAFGLLGAAAGDFFLDYGQRDGLFRQALGAFLLNQIAFIVAFAKLGRDKPWRLIRSLPVIAYCIVLAFWLVPKTGHLMLPVALYLFCLMSMAILAGRLEEKPGPIWLGAMSFVLADSLIGVNKFAEPFAYAIPIIVTFYFLGQSLIAWGLLRLRNQNLKQ